MPTLRDLVERAELGLRVAHGDTELDREVRWVHVTELADPTPYLREAELVLTNGLWLDAGADAADYVQRVAASRASGLMFGLLRERPAVPDGLVAACRRTALPLVTLPIEVPFTAVSQAMAELQADERQRELARTISRGDALARAVAEGVDQGGVLRLVGDELALPVAVVDGSGRVLACAGADPAAIDGEAVAQALAGPPRAEVDVGGGAVASLFRVGALQEAEAALLCLRPLVDLTPVERGALEQTARFLALDLARRHAVRAIESRFAGELLEMIYDPGRRGHELPGRLRSFGIDAERPLVALSVAFAGDDASAAGLADLVGGIVARHAAGVAVPQGTGDALAIAGWSGGADALAPLGEELVAAAAREWPQARTVVGIGDVVPDHRALRRSVLQAREARRAAQRRRRGPAVATFAQLGSHRMLLALHEPHVVADFAAAVLDPVREHDRRHRTELEHTLRTFLDLGGRWAEAADALHVHVNTLRNRLGRIEALTGRDLASTDDRVDFHLALHADDGA